jgi:hypothetical protein
MFLRFLNLRQEIHFEKKMGKENNSLIIRRGSHLDSSTFQLNFYSIVKLMRLSFLFLERERESVMIKIR